MNRAGISHSIWSEVERAGYPEEVANLVAFMASERASLVSGPVVTVDGDTVLRDSIY